MSQGRILFDTLKNLLKKNYYTYLICKGLKCWKDYGFSYAWGKFLEKIVYKTLPEPIGIIEKKKFLRLGVFPKDYIEKVFSECIDIIVPIYNGFDYLNRFFQTVGQTKVPYRLILIDDRSSDPRVLPVLKKYAEGKDNVLLLENKYNLGFVETANRGLNISKHNVALVNTDIELPSGWLERLMGPIVIDKKVATTTPFTNSGTICSFPIFGKDNDLFWGLSVNEIDREFKKHMPEYPIIPTGVGFCMGMSRRAIEKIGIFDVKNFGKGYGEENDWCRRAAKVGFVNIHVDNLFVYHKHGGSFDAEEKKILIRQHSARLMRKHPDYNRLVAKYCRLDPCAWLRTEIKKQLLKKFNSAYVVIAFNHSWSGGASMYLARERSKILNQDKEFIQIEYVPEVDVLNVEYYYREYYEKIKIRSNISELLEMLPSKIGEVWINELVTYPKLFQVLKEMPAYAKKHGARLIFLLHDYFALCPTINLLDVSGEYCKLPDHQDCESCLKINPHFRSIHCAERAEGLFAWRENWLVFLKQCDEIRVFSNSSRELLTQAYPELSEGCINVKPHEIDYLPWIGDKKKRTNTLNVGVIGVVAENKGVYLVEQIARLIKCDNAEIRLVIIGEARPSISSKLCYTTGIYKRYMLPRRILENDIDLVLIASIWPETFSYTTEESMKMGLPVACFDIGAPAERVKKYEKGIVLSQMDAKFVVSRLCQYAKNNIQQRCVTQNSVLFVAEEEDYASRYRVEHFQEELMFHGIDSDFVLIHKIYRIDIKRYKAIVIYRCSSVRHGSYLRKKADDAGIRLFYDIDDLIFDPEEFIKSCMSEVEKKRYLKKADGYCSNMRRADGIITSTETLANQIKRLFPEKNIWIRRNSASLEMETISVCADQRCQESDGKISIAYFSGSRTHDNDFAQIAIPLLHIMEKFPTIRLKIFGCLNIPWQLKEYMNRIDQYKFTTDWRSLPEKGVQAQIHLFPLEDTLFNACKSENKWLEAALIGRPIVASYNEELSLVIENGVTGFLCKSKEDWEDVLTQLIENPALRTRVGKKAQNIALTTHLTRNNDDSIIQFIFGDRSSKINNLSM